ncbi:unnamed protein product [Lactuca virosa]|uniref:Casein kinase II subunit beta n=1 Tax=Lactuca virosa TaxID=75947 RepID=A0AAU9MED5_9ASTR|nr:unnamed protein product [Lactuca virosa]CAH1453856.1 unnamed protein product [Lactuca virosa]
MYRERGGGGSKAKTETAMASIGGEGGSRMDGKDRNKDRLSAGDSRLSVSSYPDKKPTKGEEKVVEESETDSEEEESDVSGSDGEETSWISWFCSLRGNEFFCEVDDDYIQDDFNLCGLSNQVPFYDHALDLILDSESSHGDSFSEEQIEQIESAAETLYGLIHVRFILTTKGLAAMLEKYKNTEFGRCPRVFCSGQPCLPVGQSDISRQTSVKIYCPKCQDIFTPQFRFQDNLDGAFFGTTFPHLFFLTYGHLKPQKTTLQEYVPRVFGYKVHKP